VRQGERVLDVASGAGATALPAADRVGPTGSVLAMDLSDKLLGLATGAARERGLAQLHVRVGDFEHTGFADASYDVVLCSLGIFFAADIEAALTELWRLVAPGGRLAVSTWEGEGLGDVYDCFGDAVRDVWPQMPAPAAPPWVPISSAAKLTGVFGAAGLAVPVVLPFRLSEELDDERMWASFTGGGAGGLLNRFDQDELAAVREGLLRRLAKRGVTSIDYELLLAVATRP
jgi:SAM-dependent methyltransferase